MENYSACDHAPLIPLSKSSFATLNLCAVPFSCIVFLPSKRVVLQNKKKMFVKKQRNWNIDVYIHKWNSYQGAHSMTDFIWSSIFVHLIGLVLPLTSIILGCSLNSIWIQLDLVQYESAIQRNKECSLNYNREITVLASKTGFEFITGISFNCFQIHSFPKEKQQYKDPRFTQYLGCSLNSNWM